MRLPSCSKKPYFHSSDRLEKRNEAKKKYAVCIYVCAILQLFKADFAD